MRVRARLTRLARVTSFLSESYSGRLKKKYGRRRNRREPSREDAFPYQLLPPPYQSVVSLRTRIVYTYIPLPPADLIPRRYERLRLRAESSKTMLFQRSRRAGKFSCVYEKKISVHVRSTYIYMCVYTRLHGAFPSERGVLLLLEMSAETRSTWCSPNAPTRRSARDPSPRGAHDL